GTARARDLSKSLSPPAKARFALGVDPRDWRSAEGPRPTAANGQPSGAPPSGKGLVDGGCPRAAYIRTAALEKTTLAMDFPRQAYACAATDRTYEPRRRAEPK